jgi:hypothetical protein
MRAGVARALIVGVACCAICAQPAASRTRVLAHRKVAVRGSVRHSWSRPDSEPCQATGDGFLSARFQSTHPQRTTVADNGFGLGDITWNGVFGNIRGTITAVDRRTRNPPLDGQTCDSFAWIGDQPRPGAEDLRLPGYPTPARLASRHRHRIVVSVSQRHRWVRSAVTVRHVRIVFTPVR